MKPRLFVAVSLAALWLFVLFVFLQHASPVNSSPVARSSAAQLDVVINEVAWAGTAASTWDEWIELYNNTSVSISLAGWTLTTTGSVSFTIPAGKSILAGGYFLLERAEKAVTDTVADYAYGGAQIGNGGETLYLRDDTGILVDTANGDGGAWPAGSASPNYYSMERKNPLLLDTDDNWASNDGVIRNGHDANGNPINGTPKSLNSVTSANLGIIQLAPGITVMNQAIQYTLIFSNAGKLNVKDAIITDTLSSSPTSVAQTSPYMFTQVGQNLVWQVGTLLTASGNLSLTFTVTSAADFTGLLTSTAIITSEVTDYRPDNNAYTVTTWIRPPLADVGIAKSGPASVNAGHELTYTIVFSNAGEIDAANVIITDTLPLSVTFVRGTEAYAFSQPVSGTLVWMTDSVPTGGQPFSLTVFAEAASDAAPEAGGWLVNQVTITTVTSETVVVNNTATFTTQVTAQSADLSVDKSGPISVIAGTEITYTIVVSNVGQLIAAGAHVTDTLPVSVTFVRQSAPYPFTHDGRVLTWVVGDVLTSVTPISWTVTGLVDLRLAGTLTNVAEATTTSDELFTANNSDQATTLVTPPPSVVLINGVLYDGYQTNDEDEAVQVINAGLLPVNLKNYTVTDGTSPGVRFPADTFLLPYQRVWVTKDAAKFRDSFGFWPDFAQVITGTVLPLTGNWPGLANSHGDVQVKDVAGNVLDRLVYGEEILPFTGWSGLALSPYSVGPRGIEGQVIARVLDERTGLPVPDTDTAADWMQYTGNYTTGRRAMFAGWDMDMFFQPFTSTAPATITLGVGPDNTFDVVSQAIRSAQRSIEIEAYELQNYGVITKVVQQARRGISVTVLLEGQAKDTQELWACREIEAAGGQCWFMHGDARYYLIHAKLMILDRQRLVISMQNFSSGGMPDDDKSDGTFGSRGYLVYIESPELAARAGLIFDRDRDTTHTDIVRWGSSGFVDPPPGYAPITTSGGTTTTVLFPAPQVLTDATLFELFTAPEASLRQSDALLGLVARAGAGDEVYVEQMYEYPNWGDNLTAPNVRLKAYMDAARRGAKVRLLLNSGSFDEDYTDLTKNFTTTAYVNAVAQSQKLNLQARMGNPTQFGIHSKLVLIKLNSAGAAYSHVGSINGSETSSKLNREVAVQVESQALYAELARVFQADWQLSAPIFLPMVARDYAPPDHIVISEVLYDPSGNPDTGKEWIELHNPTARVMDISGWSLGDATADGEFGAGRYLFPTGTMLQPLGVIVIAQQAADVTFRPNFEFLTDPNRDDLTVPNMLPAAAWDGFGLALSNTGDHVILLNAAGQPVDAVVWGGSSYPGTLPHPGVIMSDHSLERRPAYRDTNDCAADFVDRTPPTPGKVP
jgi:uncharacterized repeat protein (TIGR01451 family)